MNMRTRCALVLAFTIVLSAQAEPPAMSTLWVARGIEAGEGVSRLRAQLPKLKGLEALRLQYQIALEAALAMHAASPETAHKRTTGGDVFHLVLKGEQGQLFDLAYAYFEGTQSPYAMQVNMLPTGWAVASVPTLPNTLLVYPAPGITLCFQIDDPLRPVALTRK